MLPTEDHSSQTDALPAAVDAKTFAIQLARIAADNNAEDVEVLDLRGLSAIADFFVIGTGTSDRQMDAVAEIMKTHARSVGRRPFKTAGTREGKWVLADYVDIVVHLFDERHRDFYDLAGLWGDAPRVDWAPATTGTEQETDADQQRSPTDS